MEPNKNETLESLWYELLQNKEIHSLKVYDIIPKAKLSADDLKKPQIVEQVEKTGHYEISIKKSEQELEMLDFLTELGYLEKKSDKVYKVEWYYDAWPYLPSVDVFGHLGIKITSKSKFTYNYFTSEQYHNFVETVKLFKVGKESGLHRHIRFDYQLVYYYDVDIYVLKDKFFDAIFITHDINEKRICIDLVQPYVRSKFSPTKTSHSKNWKPIKQINEQDFLSGAHKIEPLVDELDWKKRFIGYLMYEDEPLQLLNEPLVDDDSKKSLSQPDFFDMGEFSPSNIMARVFEDSVADYLGNLAYSTKTRLKYHGKEIDVFCEKIAKKRELVICECKLRLGESPITIDEIENFNEKKKLVTQNEIYDNIEFWLVTNMNELRDGVKEYAVTNSIVLKLAKLTQNWKMRSDWSITQLENMIE